MDNKTVNLTQLLARMMRDVISDDLTTYEAVKIFRYVSPSAEDVLRQNDHLSPKLSTLGLSNRAINALAREKITHLAQLTRLSAERLKEFNKMGTACVTEVEAVLGAHGYALETTCFKEDL